MQNDRLDEGRMTMGITIITDSGSDIKQETAGKWGVRVLPLMVRFGDEEFLDDVTLTADQMYRRMIESGELPKTGQVPPYVFELAFRAEVDRGNTVICITTSSGMSGCYHSACIAARHFPGKVTVIDSLNVCASLYVFVRYAEGLVRMGRTHEEIVHRLERDKRRLHVISLVDTLDYVRRGRKVSTAKALAGSLLRIKPIITADEEGKVKVIGKGRGELNAYRLFSQLVEDTGGIDFSLPVCMAYSGLSDANMRRYMEKEAALFKGRENEVHVVQFGATVGTYSGPDAFAIGFFHNRPASLP